MLYLVLKINISFISVPSPPENVLAEVVSPGKVKLQWGPPSKQNGVITYYIIYYNSDKNVPDNSWASIQQNGNLSFYCFLLSFFFPLLNNLQEEAF